MTTFSGKLLRINLRKKTSEVESIPDRIHRDYISARGMASKYLFDELPSGIDPLGPENKLIFSIGALAGTGLQGFSKWVVSSKSPATGTVFRSITGGNFGPWMKYAGYDMMIIEDAAETPVHLHIDRNGVHFMDASDLCGLDPKTVQARIKARYGVHTESACIGIAGENRVRYAVVASGKRSAARGGMGTVMGSKNLKAVSINTSIRKIHPFDEKSFSELIKKQIDLLKTHPRMKNMTTLGTPYITTVVNGLGILPVKNFQEGSLEGIENISGKEFLEMKKSKAGCHLCMTRCGGMRDVSAGPCRGMQVDGPEYETIFAFGPVLGIADKQFIVDANACCDHYGIDTISTGVSIAFAFELYEKGIIDRTDTGGMELRWGSRDSVFRLMEDISYNRGFGKILNQGVLKASGQIGKNAIRYAMHIKGLELPGYDPRGVKGYGLSMATSNIGASHMYGRPRDELSGKTDPHTEYGKGAAVSQVQKEQAVEDSLIACTFGNTGLDLQTYAEMLVAACGIHEFGSVDNLIKIGERILCTERCFNIREGFGRKEDILPKRILEEPLFNAGPSTGESYTQFDTLLDEYYASLGYSLDGIPSAETRLKLGIDP
ncbi:MAG: aldehyde ferredoxin oxidoreductase family protein [Thermodesulfobacteriota bacterium]